MRQQIRSRTAKNKLRPRGNIKIYDSFTTVIYTFKVSKYIIIGQSTNINVFSWLLVFLQIERERERESGI